MSIFKIANHVLKSFQDGIIGHLHIFLPKKFKNVMTNVDTISY